MDSLDALFADLCGDHWARKTVTHNDKDKGGLYVTRALEKVMTAAGKSAERYENAEDITFELVFPDTGTGVLSYYESQRDDRPEKRMGRSMVSGWLKKRDEFYIGWTGSKLIAARSDTAGTAVDEQTIVSSLTRLVSDEELRKRAGKAPRQPATKVAERKEFERSPAVVAYVQNRAGDNCEMPGCTSVLFRKADGSAYKEVHHILPLAEGGDDSVENAAALCPNCHRAQHYAENKAQLRKIIAKHVAHLEKR
ncbi:HNH endonuclease [Marinobacter sp. es.048]|uniref:HNH endonuclease n=1 Tax=Marinobacter sp. es.048 TaxID=1761795 RepID=UPI000B597587|nr:HNH endonuclease signature motif containing protein [Marinobacter sp. es.048]SNC59332.1 HNH endonuclease [Marinobacter sp. es.048]